MFVKISKNMIKIYIDCCAFFITKLKAMQYKLEAFWEVRITDSMIIFLSANIREKRICKKSKKIK